MTQHRGSGRTLTSSDGHHKLSIVAEYDDMCRKYLQIVEDVTEEENHMMHKIEVLQKRWNKRLMEFKSREDDLMTQIERQRRDIKELKELISKREEESKRESKLKDRQLAESRSAQSRYLSENKALKKVMAEVGGQLINRVSFANSSDSRELINRLIGVNSNLPTIPASDDDSSDGASLDYDKTEESMHGLAFEDATGGHVNGNNNNGNNDPTLLYRPIELATSDSQDDQDHDHHPHAETKMRRKSCDKKREKFNNAHIPQSETSGDDDGLAVSNKASAMDDIEQEIKRLQAERHEKMCSTTSTPTMNAMMQKSSKSATASRSATIRSATGSLYRTVSNSSTPLFNMNKPHSFVKKRIVRPEVCQPCGDKIGFFSDILKCETCSVVCHPGCSEKCPLPCVKMTCPSSRSAMKMILVSDYVAKDATLKVPAIIIYCCQEIERRGLQEEGLYRVNGKVQVIEELQNKILKSKNGVPNLDNVDVHVLCGVVKRFLMTLDESLLTKILWRDFVRAADEEDPIERNEHISRAINDMPLANLETLAYLMQHFHTIAHNCSLNRMTIQNLVKAIAPTIVGNSVREPPPSQLASETKKQIKVMEALFALPEEFWSQFVCKTSCADQRAEESLGKRLYQDAITNTCTTTSSSASQPTSASTPKRSKRSATFQRPHLSQWK